MKNIYLLIIAIGLLNVGCQKDDHNSIIGKWEVTSRSPYHYEIDGAYKTGLPLVTVAPGSYVWEIAANDTYTSTNTTYITVVSTGRYNVDGKSLTVTQETYHNQPKPEVIKYTLNFSDNNETLTMNETSGNLKSVIKMKRVN